MFDFVHKFGYLSLAIVTLVWVIVVVAGWWLFKEGIRDYRVMKKRKKNR